MGKGLLQAGAVGHNGVGQVGQVPFAEEGQGKLAQLFRQPHPAGGTLLIGAQVGMLVFDAVDPINQRQNGQGPSGITPYAGGGIGAAPKGRDHGPQDQEEQPHRGHQAQVAQGTPEHAGHHAFGPLLGKGEPMLQLADHTPAASFPTFHWAEVW